MGIPEKIKAIQDEMARTQVNKATEHHLGLLKAKVAKLRREQDDQQARKSGGQSDGFDVRRAGDATVVFIGLPSVGKSTLLNRLTGAKSAVGAFQFTTLTVVPGMMEYKGARIQVLDLPGIIKGASSGRGLGKRILSVARSADLVLLILDVFQPYHEDVLVAELGNMGIRLNQSPPDMVIEKTHTGGISIAQQRPLTLTTERFVRDLLRLYGYTSARVVIREDVTSEQLVDRLTGNKTYAKALTVINKIDLVDDAFVESLRSRVRPGFVQVSADSDRNIDVLREEIYRRLEFIRVYMRPKGGQTDYAEPLIMRRGATVGAVCDKLHRSMRREFRYALVWGESVKFGGQRVGIDHALRDEDVLTIVKAR